MKKLITILIASILFVSCQKTVTIEQHNNINQLIQHDVVLEISKEKETALRKKPLPPNNPHSNPNDTVTPPPPTTGKGCFLIDFNGHNTDGLFGAFYCAQSNLDLVQQLSILSRVRSDYSFENSIVITTDEAIYNTYPQNKRRRCVVTTTNFYGNVGGVSYINSFSWFDNTDCFVFPVLLSNNIKYISDAISHEFGHTVGLYHAVYVTYFPDGTCVKNSEYLIGQFIMGNSYSSCCPVFDIVETGCGILEDEKLIISNTVKQ